MRLPLPCYWTLRTLVGTSPWLFYGLFRLCGGDQDRLVDRRTELVIDGFPRSGNSFAVFAFDAAEGRAMRIAHHIHAPCQIIRAARLGIPACVVIREPEQVVPAALRKIPHFAAKDLLIAYLLYYRVLWRWRSHFVVAPLELARENFGRIVARLNNRFGPRFSVLEPARQRSLTPSFLAQERRQTARIAASGRFGLADRARDPEAEAAAHPRLLAACQALYRDYRALAEDGAGS